MHESVYYFYKTACKPYKEYKFGKHFIVKTKILETSLLARITITQSNHFVT